jgi:polysaccharide pyruvyl transferase WcaK-like protein
MKTAARLATYRSYRDNLSKEFMISIGAHVAGDLIFPDVVFSHPPPLHSGESTLRNPPTTIGIGVMAYYGWHNNPTKGMRIYDTYIAKMSEFLIWLLNGGYKIRILLGEETDIRAARDLMARVESHKHISGVSVVSETIACFSDLLSETAKTDLVVCSRYHNIVAALLSGKPVLSCGYARKNDVLLAEMGLADFCQQLEQMDVELLKRQFERLVDERYDICKQLNKKTNEYRQILTRQFREVFSVL